MRLPRAVLGPPSPPQSIAPRSRRDQPTCRRDGPAFGPFLPSRAPHATSTRPPNWRANPCLSCHDLGLIRSVLIHYTLLYSLHPPPVLSQAPLPRNGRRFASVNRCAPVPGPNLGPLALPSSPTDLPGRGPLKPTSEVAPTPFAAARTALTRVCLLAPAGPFLGETRTQGRRGAPP